MLHATYAKLRYSTFIDFVICQADWRRLTTWFRFFSILSPFISNTFLSLSHSLDSPFRNENAPIRFQGIRILIWFWWNILWLSREMNTSLMAMFGTFRFDQQFIWRIWGLSVAVVCETQKCVRLSIFLRSLSFPMLFSIKNNKRSHFGVRKFNQPWLVNERCSKNKKAYMLWNPLWKENRQFFSSLFFTPGFSVFFLRFADFVFSLWHWFGSADVLISIWLNMIGDC